MDAAARTQIASSVAATQDLRRPASWNFDDQSKERSRRHPLTSTPEQQRSSIGSQRCRQQLNQADARLLMMPTVLAMAASGPSWKEDH